MFQNILSFFRRDSAIFAILAIYYVFIICITPLSGHYDLTGFFIPWITEMQERGIHRIYENTMINYPPITLYVMYMFSLAVQLFDAKLGSAIYYLKDLVFLFDLASFYVIFKIMQRFKVPLGYMVLFLANIAIIYNTIFWGQVDSIYTLFVLLSVYFVATKRPLWCIAAFICALAAKPQALLFIPLIGLLLLPFFIKKPDLIGKAVLIVVGTTTVIFLPFILTGNLGDYMQVIKKTTDYYPKVSMYAFNFWLLLFGFEQIEKVSDTGKLLGLTYRTWGLGMFAMWSLVVLYPLFMVVRSQIKHVRALTEREWQIIFLAFTLVTVVFFFFNTQMHERYVHAAVMFAAVFAVLSKRYIVYAVLSLAYIVNLTDVHSAMAINPSAIIQPHIAALLFAGVIFYGTYELYHLLFKNNKELHTHPHQHLLHRE